MDSVKELCKFFLAFLFPFLFVFCIVQEVHAQILPIYDNPGQGVFQCHDNGKINNDYLKGGGVIVRWDQLQPVDNEHLDQTALTNLANKIKAGGKKAYLHFQIYAILQGDADRDVLPSWLYSQVATITLNNSRHPVPWDLVYQQKLGRFLELLAAGLTEKGAMPYIEYLEPAAGGMWGSTHLWVNTRDLCNLARVAGCGGVSENICSSLPNTKDTSVCPAYAGTWQCLGTKFTQGVNAVFERYLTAFPDLAIIRAGGSCLCGQACNYKGMDYMLNKYGMRFMIKGVGLGALESNCGMQEDLGTACKYGSNMTKCGQEPWLQSKVCGGGTGGFDAGCGYKSTYNTSLNNEKISYYCIYSQDLGCNAIDPGSGESINNINRWVAQNVGSQIYLTNKSINTNWANTGSPVTVSVSWKNQGSAPLTAPLKQGIKWVPSSYKLFVEFVKDGTVASYQEVALNPQTNQWPTLPSPTAVTTSTTFNIPASLGGATTGSEITYKVYIGLTDPNGERKRFVLRNTEAENETGNRRYLLSGAFSVAKGPPQTGGGCSCPSGKPLKSSGNANCDSSIDLRDFFIWRSEFLNHSGTTADFNCSNKVDISDFFIWRRGFLAQ